MQIFKLPYKNFKLVILDRFNIPNDRPKIKELAPTIFNIIASTYNNIGGCSIYDHVEHMIKSIGRYKIIIDDSEQIYAAATYQYKERTSYKCTLIAKNMHHNDIDAKEAVQWIIKSDIVNWKKLYWIEAYDAVAHWHEKYGAIKIPAVYVPHILGGTQGQQVVLSDDPYVYERPIKGINGLKPKIMFGFNSEENIHKLLNEEQILAYTEHLNKLYNGITGKLLESNLPVHRIKNIRASLYFIEKSYKKKGQFRNILSSTHRTMAAIYKEAVQMLKDYRLPEQTKREVKYLCEFCKNAALNANIIRVHKLFQD